MELQFQKDSRRCLCPALYEVKNQELTQELKLSDAMPDIGRIVASWGQVILRGKEWRGDSISLSGGMMVWVLYMPEDGGTPGIMDAWIPFQMKWDLPEKTREGDIRICPRIRFVDARSVSPRKIMVRAGLAVRAEALEKVDFDVYVPGELPEDVQLLVNTYPVQLAREAGEKAFSLDEDLELSHSGAAVQKLVCYTLRPEITDRKVMSDKVVFRGNGNLHVLFMLEDGKLYTQDYPLNYSQFAQLDGVYGTDGTVDIEPAVTALEAELTEDGHLRVKAGLVAQYLVTDREMLSVAQDVYSNLRQTQAVTESMGVPALLDSRNENMYAEQTIPESGATVVDVLCLPDHPGQRRMEDQVRLELPGQFQTVYYDTAGNLQSSVTRWEKDMTVAAHGDSRLAAEVRLADAPRAEPGENGMDLKAELCLSYRAYSREGINCISALKLGEPEQPDPARPGLILKRYRREGLWKMARDAGSTVDAIRAANQLKDEPAENQMLIIPVF